jgi:carboxypeptidase Q
VLFNKVMPRSRGFEGYGAVVPMRGRGAIEAAKLGAVAALIRSVGTGAYQLPHTGATRYDDKIEKIPFAAITAEDADQIHRLLASGEPVKLKLRLTCKRAGEVESANVVGELLGREKPEEVVLIGAHLDSWHSATGASDNADGAAAALEAMRILRAVDARPRRTIRVALWGGEEEGLLGSKAYVAQHLAGDANQQARDRLSVYLNLDPGMGPIYGWYLEESAGAKTLFDQWLRPLQDLGGRRNVTPGIGNTDHLSFKAAGIPGFNPVQDYTTYDVRTHHTNVDTYERVQEKDLKQNAVVLAWFAYNAAMTDQRFPRDFK